ncbi:hypothetical protein Daura_26520 [Dactylosporangium aurantiacum]|uniref:Uncharacterized protein n=1 Tax=Dactylosporangium aurantiacum TaxID=35754 RepID=A0A9Q9I8L6_9ACTN|nr:hypothetical protein [Dactylosporangium aurantiacum]MDG6109308.1 hypothetical protein [Dactylosporangium aurantiacum]UWZ50391.1 hypothetical protein Daura_26520 [Dactylosporangium aurantiacum]
MRPRITLTALVAATILAAVAVVAALDATRGRHVALRPLNHPFVALVLLCAVMIVALWHFQPEGTRRLLAQAGVGVVALAVAGTGALVADTRGWDPHDPRVVATDGHLRVVAWRVHGTGGRDLVLLRLRTGDGLFGRDSGADLACFLEGADAGAAAWTFAAASLRGDTLIALTRDGREWQVRFDLVSLRPTGPAVDRCGGAPGYAD